jgi:hypothetical protein
VGRKRTREKKKEKEEFEMRYLQREPCFGVSSHLSRTEEHLG